MCSVGSYFPLLRTFSFFFIYTVDMDPPKREMNCLLIIYYSTNKNSLPLLYSLVLLSFSLCADCISCVCLLVDLVFVCCCEKGLGLIPS